MKVALVHDFFNQFGGGERVLQTFSEIYPEAPVYVITTDTRLTDEKLPGRTVITSFLQNWLGMPSSYKWYLPFMPRAVESFDLSEYDLILSDSSAYAKGVITDKQQKHICYLHTPTRYLWSDREEYLQNAPIPAIVRPFLPFVIRRLQAWDLKAAKRPDVIIANSENIKERAEKYYHRTSDYVLFPPVDCSTFTPSEVISDYYLVVARNEPYKRTEIVVEAATKLGIKLKVAGGGTKLEELKKSAGPTVEFLGRVDDEELAELYRHALGFIFPPNEDAGITPLEAMASGRPVLAYGKGGVLESVVAGKTGEFFAKQSVDSLCEAWKKFDPSRYDPREIRAHAIKFDKEVFKKRIMEIVSRTTGKGQSLT